MEDRWRRAVAGGHQARLIERIAVLLEQAVQARTPNKRPPGKAGLRAEKGYYRLLYLQDDFQMRVKSLQNASAGEGVFGWRWIQRLLDQLADIPELRSEVGEGIDAALQEVATCFNRPS
ncbi:MAG TPA: hypothetical protein VLT88_13065 [Desulfosarcina sp.]|nr:hypothetical protein [Desulfosarcina sp.]